MRDLPSLRFVEQHDPTDEHVKSQPYAYVADVVHTINLSADIDALKPNSTLANKADVARTQAATRLRDLLDKDAKLAWYIVICGDEERWAPSEGDEGEVGTLVGTRSTSVHMSAGSATTSSLHRSTGSEASRTGDRSLSVSTQQSQQANGGEVAAPSPTARTESASDAVSSCRNNASDESDADITKLPSARNAETVPPQRIRKRKV